MKARSQLSSRTGTRERYISWLDLDRRTTGQISGFRTAWAEVGEGHDQTAAAGRRLPPPASTAPPSGSVLADGFGTPRDICSMKPAALGGPPPVGGRFYGEA